MYKAWLSIIQGDKINDYILFYSYPVIMAGISGAIRKIEDNEDSSTVYIYMMKVVHIDKCGVDCVHFTIEPFVL